jgi:hypothetical protein
MNKIKKIIGIAEIKKKEAQQKVYNNWRFRGLERAKLPTDTAIPMAIGMALLRIKCKNKIVNLAQSKLKAQCFLMPYIPYINRCI